MFVIMLVKTNPPSLKADYGPAITLVFCILKRCSIDHGLRCLSLRSSITISSAEKSVKRNYSLLLIGN